MINDTLSLQVSRGCPVGSRGMVMYGDGCIVCMIQCKRLTCRLESAYTALSQRFWYLDYEIGIWEIYFCHIFTKRTFGPSLSS